MKNVGFIVSIMMLLLVFSCKKNDSPEPKTGTELKFISLTAADSSIDVNGVTTLTAVAEGDGLTYTWSSFYGTIIGSGSVVQWTVCHADYFKIMCEVRDLNNNSVRDSVYVNVK